MAGLTKEQKSMREINKLANKTSQAIYGVGQELDIESTLAGDIFAQTAQLSASKYSYKQDGRNLDGYTQAAMSSIFNLNNMGKGDKKSKNADDEINKFKKFMETNNFKGHNEIITRDQSLTAVYANYQAIIKHIPELAKALNTINNNVISPDDFNKQGFDNDYTGNCTEKKKEIIKKNCDNIVERYNLEEKIRGYVNDANINGIVYIAVLSMDREISSLLGDDAMNGMLNESINSYDKEYKDYSYTIKDLNLTKTQKSTLLEYFNIKSAKVLEEELRANGNVSISTREINNAVDKLLVEQLNSKFEISSKYNLFKENIEMEVDKHKTLLEQGYIFDEGKYVLMENDVPDNGVKSKGRGKGKGKVTKRDDGKPLYLTGSVIRDLNPINIIDLEIDGVDYGKYYIEYDENGSINGGDSEHPTLGGAAMFGNTVGDVNQMTGGFGNNQGDVKSSGSPAAKKYKVSEEKMKMITDLFLNTISVKIDKNYVRKNKNFKDFIYTMLKQEHATKSNAKITYFAPGEVITIKTDAVLEPIAYFAKLYMAMLTNIMMLNISRGHDKKIFYVNTGLDGDFSQATESLVHHFKSKEIRLNDHDITSILSLNYGILDDVFVPSIGGNRPFDVDILQGQEVDPQSNAFLDWLKRSCLNGMNVPAIYLDMAAEMDFSRTVASNNGEFARSIIHKQAHFQKGFTKMLQKLYYNEYRFNEDGDSDLSETTNIEDIKAILHPPTVLLNQMLSEQLSTVSQIAEEVASAVEPPKQDGSNEDVRNDIRAAVLRDKCPGIEWNKYFKMAKELRDKHKIESIDRYFTPKTKEEDEYDNGNMY